MEQYISKSALVAEVEKRLDELYELLPNASKVESSTISISEACNTGKYTALESFKDYLDTLEVKEVEKPTASDRGMAEEIIINLKRVEQDYHIDLTREMEWLRNLMKKGE